VNEPHGVRVWAPVSAGIGLWMIHLTALSALTRTACRHDLTWVAHAITAATAGLTVLAMLGCEALRRQGQRDPADDEDGRELRLNLVFVGWLGLIIGGFSLALILYEGSWAATVPACHP
jgi:hypothetical protein